MYNTGVKPRHVDHNYIISTCLVSGQCHIHGDHSDHEERDTSQHHDLPLLCLQDLLHVELRVTSFRPVGAHSVDDCPVSGRHARLEGQTRCVRCRAQLSVCQRFAFDMTGVQIPIRVTHSGRKTRQLFTVHVNVNGHPPRVGRHVCVRASTLGIIYVYRTRAYIYPLIVIHIHRTCRLDPIQSRVYLRIRDIE